MLALAAPGVELLGISAVHGNVAVDQVGRNIGRILTLCGRGDVPFCLGADEPLVAPAMDASYVSRTVNLDMLYGCRSGSCSDMPSRLPRYGTLLCASACTSHFRHMLLCAAVQFHGKDGLGDRPEASPSYADVHLQAQPGHAAMHLAAAAQVGLCEAGWLVSQSLQGGYLGKAQLRCCRQVFRSMAGWL